MPSDFTKLFDETLFRFDTNIIPEAVALYEVRRWTQHDGFNDCSPTEPIGLPPRLNSFSAVMSLRCVLHRSN